MKYFTLLITLCCLFASTAMAQNKWARKADKLYDLNKFAEAIPLFQKSLEKDDNRVVKTKLANCYRRTNQMDKSEKLYREIIESGRFHDKVLLYYSEALMTNEKYEDAKDYLQRYITREPDDERAHLLLASCKAVNTIEPYFQTFRRKRFTQNSENDDSSPVYYRNGIVFTSDRNQGAKFLKQKSGWTGRDYAMIYYSAQNIDGTFEIPVSLSSKFNDLNLNSGPVSFTADGKYAVFSRNSKTANNSDEYPMQLYSATADEEGKWKDVELISFCRNTTSYMHPAISPDGQFLYYVTDRSRGYGGTDLYVAERKTDGSWDDPENMGPVVNTVLNEGFPFAHADGRVFFSSKGHPGYGGFDLFVTQRDASGNWTTPVNLGRPVNSSEDDVSFFLFADESGGFYSSAVDKGHDDIYLFSLQDKEEIFVRFEDEAQREEKLAANATPTETEPKEVDTEAETNDAPADEMASTYQPASEVTTNQPFNDEQQLKNDTEELIDSGNQRGISESSAADDSQQAALEKDILPDTQVSLAQAEDKKAEIKEKSTTTPPPTTEKPVVREEKEMAEEISEATTTPATAITQSETEDPVSSEPTTDTVSPAIADQEETKQAVTRTKSETPRKEEPVITQSETEDPVSSEPTTDPASPETTAQEETKQAATNTKPEAPRKEEPVSVANKAEKDPKAPKQKKPAAEQQEIAEDSSLPAEGKTDAPSVSTDQEAVADNEPADSEPTTNPPSNNTATESTQDLELYPGKEPVIEPKVTEEIRPYREKETTKATAKTADAFGAIEQELANNTLSTGRTFVLPGVKYPFNEFVFQVTDAIRYELDRLAFLLKDHPDLRIEIGCYSESFGEDGVNQALSRYRAQAAADYLVKQGIESSRISAKGYGETKPLNQCVNGVLCTRNDHMVNQRMEIKVIGL